MDFKKFNEKERRGRITRRVILEAALKVEQRIVQGLPCRPLELAIHKAMDQAVQRNPMAWMPR